MPVNIENYKKIQEELESKNITLVAVSKTKPIEDILELYQLGHRNFGENYVQEMVEKAARLPKDIRWHFIGHLQSNKVKQIAPFVHLVHGVDSLKLLKEINKEGGKNGRILDCLLQAHIASEETKFGLNIEELNEIVDQIDKLNLKNIQVCGLMGMASFTEDMKKVRAEFRELKRIFETQVQHHHFTILSMGMSSDYPVAIEEGSTMVRIGSLLFGARNTN